MPDLPEFELVSEDIRPLGFVFAGATMLTLVTIYMQGIPVGAGETTEGIVVNLLLPAVVYAISFALIWATISVLDAG